MAHTAALAQFMAQLSSDPALQSQLKNQPSQAVAAFGITGHERDALMTLDADDFVQLGFAPSVWHLPPPLRPTPSISIDEAVADLRRQLEKLIRERLEVGPFPPPGPFPSPKPHKRPRPEPDLPPLSAAPKPSRAVAAARRAAEQPKPKATRGGRRR